MIIEKRKENKYLIFSDSQSVLMALDSKKGLTKKSHIIYKIKEKLILLKNQGKNIIMNWIPAHAGIEYNEKVDEAAKLSIQQGIDSAIFLPNSDFKAEWKLLMRKEFNNWCLESSDTKGVVYFKNHYKNSISPWFSKFKFKRRSIVSINRMRSGHNSVYTSLKKINMKNDCTCDCGENDETLNHIFFQCKKYKKQRKFFIELLVKNKKLPPYNIESILSTMYESDIINIAKFINSIEKNI